MLATDFKEWRKKLGVTQEEAASRIFHVSRVTVQNWESGVSPISQSVEMNCRLHLEHWEQEERRRPGYGPVVLRDAGGYPGPRRNIRETFSNNEAALARATVLYAENEGIDLFISSEDERDIWRIPELREEIARRRNNKKKNVAEMIAKMNEIADHFSSLPVLDDRTDDEILGYDERGLPR
jgi:DNA-binding XRE family transcriptional regulator